MENKKPICPTCQKEVKTFDDNQSLREFTISGMCQECQDKTFDAQLDVLSDIIIDSFLDKRKREVLQ